MTEHNDLDVVVLECPECGALYDADPWGPDHLCGAVTEDADLAGADDGRKPCEKCADGFVWNPTVDGNVEECRYCGGTGIASYKGFTNLIGPCDEVVGEFTVDGEVFPLVCEGTEFYPWDEDPAYGVCRDCGHCCAHNKREAVRP